MDLIMCKWKVRCNRFKKIKAEVNKLMLNSNKKMNVKVLQSVQSKLLAVVEKLETSEDVVNILDRKEGYSDHERAIEGEQDNFVEDVKQLNPIK